MCTQVPLAPAEIRTLYYEQHENTASWWYPFIDATAPCHVFRRAAFGGSIQRSDAGGVAGTYTTVFGSAHFYPQEPAFLGPGTFLLPDDGASNDFSGQTGGAMVKTGDEGGNWSPAANGLSHQRVVQVATSRASAMVAYALTDAALFASADAGASWHLTALPAAGGQALSSALGSPGNGILHPIVAVDPGDASHVFLVQPQAGLIFGSADGGQSWAPHPLPAGLVAARLDVVRRGDGVVLYVGGTGAQAGDQQLAVSVDDGASWNALRLPGNALMNQAYAFDPRDSSRAVWTGMSADGRALLQAFSSDGLQTYYQVQSHPYCVPFASAALDLHVSQAGDYFLHTTGTLVQGPGPRYDSLIRFNEGASVRTLYLPDCPTPNYAKPPPAPPAGRAATELATCHLGGHAGIGTINALGAQGAEYSSITFDGRFLDYTEPNISDRILRLDPRSCQLQSDIMVNTGAVVGLHFLQLTYDARHDGFWAAGASGDDPRAQGVPVYFISRATGRGSLVFATAVATYSNTTGDALLNYDFFLDKLWSSDRNGDAALLNLDGTPARATCMADLARKINAQGNSMSMWSVAGPGRMYVGFEDDQTVLEVSSVTCLRLSGGFTHRTYSESSSEDDEMVCDSVSFGAGSYAAGNLHGGTSVLWIRDSTPDTVSAYGIPDGNCPFPTGTRYLGDASVVQGDSARLCGDLYTGHAPDNDTELLNQPLAFTLAGVDEGTASTANTAIACVMQQVKLKPGRYLVTVGFGGNPAYTPSSGQGYLDVLAPPAAPVPPPPLVPGIAALPLPPPPAQPPPPEPIAVTQVQAESQAQAHVQNQVSTQAAVMPQQQGQRQVARQSQRREQEQRRAEFAASALLVALMTAAALSVSRHHAPARPG
ncbi:MAG: WD40/YVTN/BNR-like repeat-containing protein [Candidatus Dormibacteria bacterium]